VGYALQWASPVPVEKYFVGQSPFDALKLFMADCNITQPPSFEVSLF
jgi:hypothetical protein